LDLATAANPVGSLARATGVANMTSFSPDGRRLCTFSWYGSDRTAWVWTWERSERFSNWTSDAVNYATLSRDGQRPGDSLALTGSARL